MWQMCVCVYHLSVYLYMCVKVKMLVAQSCPTLCDPMDYIASVQGILQERILDWVAIPFSRGSSWLRDQTQVSLHGGQSLYPLSQQGDIHVYMCVYVYIYMHTFDKVGIPVWGSLVQGYQSLLTVASFLSREVTEHEEADSTQAENVGRNSILVA